MCVKQDQLSADPLSIGPDLSDPVSPIKAQIVGLLQAVSYLKGTQKFMCEKLINLKVADFVHSLILSISL